MKKQTIAILAGVLVQVCVLAGLLHYCWIPYRTDGIEVTVRTVPVDPRDLFRGEYVELEYEFNSLSLLSQEERNSGGSVKGKEVFTTLSRIPGSELWHMTSQSLKEPEKNSPGGETVFLRGRVRSDSWWGRRRINYGIEQFFTQEGTAKEIELAGGWSERKRQAVEVTLRVTPNGRAAVKSVRVVDVTQEHLSEEVEFAPTELENPSEDSGVAWDI